MATLVIKALQEMAWRWYEDDIADARAERDEFKRTLGQLLGKEQADTIARYVHAAVNPSISSPLPYLATISDKAFLELVTLELALKEIEGRVESLATFFDPCTADAVLPTLGLSWWVDIRPMIQPPGHHGQMSAKNVRRFLIMVKQARQCLPTRRQIEERGGTVDPIIGLDRWHEHFRRKRRRLIDFLERAVRLGEPIYCEL